MIYMAHEFNNFYRALGKYTSQNEIVALCYNALIDSYDRVKLVKNIKSRNENRIRDEFVLDIEENNKIIKHAIDNYIIKITPESWNLKKRNRTDILFTLNPCQRDLIFECKKLSCADQRYVNDGLVRFINLAYAEKEKDAGMIGFVVNKNLTQTMNGLKAKVSGVHIVEMVDEAVYGFEHSFQSVHERDDLSEIKLSHLFFHFA